MSQIVVRGAQHVNDPKQSSRCPARAAHTAPGDCRCQPRRRRDGPLTITSAVHLLARSFALLVVAASATSCSTAPKPRTPAPTALVCPAPVPTPPDSIAGSRNLVVNGGFDTPRITGRRAVSTLAGWLGKGTVKLVASPSCGAVPGSGQYVALGYGASISQAVPTVPGKLYLFQAAESMEGVCNIAYSEVDTYWNSTLVSSTTTPATGRTPDAGDNAWGAYGTYTPTFTAKSATAVIRIVATTEAFSCAFDVANVSVTLKSSPIP